MGGDNSGSMGPVGDILFRGGVGDWKSALFFF